VPGTLVPPVCQVENLSDWLPRSRQRVRIQQGKGCSTVLQNATAWRLTVSRCVRSSEYRTEGIWVTRHIQKRWSSLVNDMVGQSRPRGIISPSRGEASSEKSVM